MGAPIETPAGFIKFAPVEIGGPDRQEEGNPRPAASPAEGDGLGDKGDVASKQTTLDDAVGPNDIDQSEGSGVVDDPADNNSDDNGEPDDGTLEPAPTIDSADEVEAADRTDDSDDEDDRPQPVRVVDLPEDFDWRRLKPRRYGKSLPPLDPVERQSLEESMVNHGFLGKMLIDDLLQIIEGNTRWEICCERGIVPTVEMIAGLSDEEKEELAFSCNLDRRQLKDEDAIQALDARFDNLLDARRKDEKKWTQQRIAAVLGVSVSTVSARERFRHNSEGGTVSKPDARRKYDDELKREAVRLVNEGNPEAEVARRLVMHPKAVQRAVKESKAGEDAAKGGKRKKAAAAKPVQPIEDIAASDGVPEPHRRAIESLGQDTHAYIERFKARAAETRKDIEAASDNDELVNFSVLCSTGLALANFQLNKSLCAGGEEAAPPGDSCPNLVGHEPDTVLLGIVMAIEPDEVFVALSAGGGGVIDNHDGCLAWHAPLEVDGVVRVRIEGFDWKRGAWKLKLLGRQTVAPAPGAIAARSDRDDRYSPFVKLAGRKAGPKDKEVTK